jgi:hypothetical protein
MGMRMPGNVTTVFAPFIILLVVMDITPISTLEEQQDQLHLSSAEDIKLLHNAIRTTTAGIFEHAKQ